VAPARRLLVTPARSMPPSPQVATALGRGQPLGTPEFTEAGVILAITYSIREGRRRFKDEAEFNAFDDKFHKERKIAAVYALLDDIVEAEKSDFKIFARRL